MTSGIAKRTGGNLHSGSADIPSMRIAQTVGAVVLVIAIGFGGGNGKDRYRIMYFSRVSATKLRGRRVTLGSIEGICKEISTAFDHMEGNCRHLGLFVHPIYGNQKDDFEPFRFF